MKLRILSFLFLCSEALCRFTAWLNHKAGQDHQYYWRRCTNANLASCNSRQACRTRFS